MNENINAMPPEEQAENDRDARAEELESTFSYDGYQVVRKELFAHLRDPAIVIRKDSITFGRQKNSRVAPVYQLAIWAVRW